jgi:hypothetical protein
LKNWILHTGLMVIKRKFFGERHVILQVLNDRHARDSLANKRNQTINLVFVI